MSLGTIPRPTAVKKDALKPWQRDLIQGIVIYFGDAWFWMIGAGVLHASYRQIPAIGYWTALLFGFFFGGGAQQRQRIWWRVKVLNGEKP